MVNGKRVVVVLPAFNAEKTLEKTYLQIDKVVVDSIVLVDDCSTDYTLEVAKRLNIAVYRHYKNKGYGGNQKTCYHLARQYKAGIVVMLHRLAFLF